MDQMKLKGYVCPEDFEGTDTEKIIYAIDTAKEKDICKVVLCGDYTLEKTVAVPPLMHIIIEGTLTASGDFPVFINTNVLKDDFYHAYAFTEDMFYIEGKGTVNGDMSFYNAYRIVIENLKINGDLSFEFTNEVRLSNLSINGEKCVDIRRGSTNFIIEHLELNGKKCGISLDVSDTENDYVIGKEANIDEIIINSNHIIAPKAVIMEANSENAIFNTVIEDNHISAVGLCISKRAGKLAAEQYRDITATGFTPESAVKTEIYSDTKHCFFN